MHFPCTCCDPHPGKPLHALKQQREEHITEKKHGDDDCEAKVI
jgi:hypothetical protein